MEFDIARIGEVAMIVLGLIGIAYGIWCSWEYDESKGNRWIDED